MLFDINSQVISTAFNVLGTDRLLATTTADGREEGNKGGRAVGDEGSGWVDCFP